MFQTFPPQLRWLLLIGSAKPLALVALMSAGLGVGLGFAVNPLVGAVVALVIVVLSAAFAIWWSQKAWERLSWVIGPQTVELKVGVFWRRHVVLPRNRVQNVTIATGPIRSALSLVTVTVHSAGAATPNVTFLGVTPEQGEWAQQQLLGTNP